MRSMVLSCLLAGCGYLPQSPADRVAESLSTAGMGWYPLWGQVGMGGYATSDPVMMQTSDFVYHVFVKGGENSVWESHSTNGFVWTPWVSGGGTIAGNLAVAGNQQNEICVFVRGFDNRIYYRVFANGGWQPVSGGQADGWGKLDGIVAAQDPVATQTNRAFTPFAPSELGVYVSAFDNANNHLSLYRLATSGDPMILQSWFGTDSVARWQNLTSGTRSLALFSPGTATPYYAVAGIENASFVHEIVAVDSNQHAFRLQCHGDSFPNEEHCDLQWSALPPTFAVAAPPTVAIRNNATGSAPDVLAMDFNNTFHHSTMASGAWSAWDAAGGFGYRSLSATSRPAMVFWGDEDLIAVVQDANLNYFWNHFTGTTNQWDGWQMVANAPCMGANALPALLTDVNGARAHYVYTIVVGADHSISSTAFQPGGSQNGSQGVCCGQTSQACCNFTTCTSTLTFCNYANICQRY